MIWFVFVLMLLIFCQIRYDDFHQDYMGFEQSTAVKGIFAFLIFISHAKGYLTLSDTVGNMIVTKTLYAVGQSMVTMYFFYSGYGIMESYKHKTGYTEKFFQNRIIKTLVHFDMAVVLYMILNLILGRKYSLKANLLSLVGWNSIGNSNWFICVILMLYLITLSAFLMIGHQKRNETALITIVSSLSVILWFCFALSDRPGYWYNTFLTYPAGMIFSVLKSRIDRMMKNKKGYWMSAAVIFALICVCYICRGSNVIYTVFSLAVSLLIVMTTMKLKINNAYLQFLGKYSFSIYILQRLPMIVLSHFGIADPFLFTLVSLIIVLILAYFFEKLLKIVDRSVLGVR